MKAYPHVIGNFEPKESLDDWRGKNQELGIKEDNKHINNDIHKVLLNGVAFEDACLVGIKEEEFSWIEYKTEATIWSKKELILLLWK
jgi:hypothetical protein